MAIDKKIVQDFIIGDQAAFKVLYELTKNSIYSVVYRMTGNHHDSEDIMHDVFIRVYEKRKMYNPDKASLHTWIYQVAVNYTLNVLKKQKRWQRNIVCEEVNDDVLEKITDSEDKIIVLEVLNKVSPDYRVCLVLREVESKSYEEIANILKISIGTVRSRISRGRQELKKLFLNQARR